MKSLRKSLWKSQLSLTFGAIILPVISASVTHAQNLIQNPGFETTNRANPGDAPPWTFGGGTGTVAPYADYAHTGVSSLPIAGFNVFANTVLNGSATQTFAVPVAGTYLFSFYEAIRTNGGLPGSDRLVASFNGVNAVNAIFSNAAFQQVSTQVVLNAGATTLSLQGTFISGGPVFFSSLHLDDFSLTLLMAANLTLAPNLAALAQTQNQLGAALGLTNAFNAANLGTTTAPNGVAGAFVQALNNTPAGAMPAVLDSLTGEGITAAQNAAFTAGRMFTGGIADQILLFGGAPNSVVVPTASAAAPLQYAPTQAFATPIRVREPVPAARPLYSWRAWGVGYGASQTINANAVLGNARQNIGMGGGAVGVDYTWAPGMLTGIAVGGSDGSFSVGARQTSGSTTGGHAAWYTLAEFGNIYAASTTSVSMFGNRTTRTVGGFGGLNGEILRGNFTSTEFRSRVEFGYRFGLTPSVTLTPFYAVEAAKLRSNGFTETPTAGVGLFALNVRGQTASSVPMFFGARLTSDLDLGNGMRLRPSLQAAYVPEFAPARNQVAGLINLPGAAFLTDGARPARSSAQVKAGAELSLLDNVALSANFDGEFSNRANTYAGKGAVKVRW